MHLLDPHNQCSTGAGIRIDNPDKLSSSEEFMGGPGGVLCLHHRGSDVGAWNIEQIHPPFLHKEKSTEGFCHAECIGDIRDILEGYYRMKPKFPDGLLCLYFYILKIKYL